MTAAPPRIGNEHAGSLPMVVIGAGLAGLTAALDLSDAGHRVVLLEARARAGGSTTSFDRAGTSERPALVVDTGQHVGLRCYEQWLGLLRRLGTGDLVSIQSRLRIPVLREQTVGPPGRAVLTRDPLPAPAHLLRALLGYRLLAPAARLRALRGALALRSLEPADPDLDAVSFGDWLRGHGQDAATVAALWDLFTVAACNAGADEVSLATAATVLRRALLDTRDAADIALPGVPLAALQVDPAVRVLRAAGAAVHLRTPVREIRRAAGSLQVLTADDTLEAAGVVCAVPAHAARALLPAQVSVPTTLDYQPIVNVHIVFDRPVMAEPFLAAVHSDAQWVFDRSGPSGLAGAGGAFVGCQYLAVSVSAAGQLVDVPAADLVARLTSQLRRLLPAAGPARVVDAFVTRERRAAFVAAPGSAGLRPVAATGVAGLALAGAWTATGLPDTMEGAVVSGHAAARAIAGRDQQPPDQQPPDQQLPGQQLPPERSPGEQMTVGQMTVGPGRERIRAG